MTDNDKKIKQPLNFQANPDDPHNFKKMRGKLKQIYSDDRALIKATGGRKDYADKTKLKSREDLLKTFNDSLGDSRKASAYSETLMASDGNYAEIINYYVNMPLYRYTVIPTQVKKVNKQSTPENKFSEMYEKMMNVVDGISLEVVLPKILQVGMVYGIIYIYLDKDVSSETVETFILPYSYCRQGFVTNFATETVIFDFKFFTDLKNKLQKANGILIEDEMFYELFPAEMVNQYIAYTKDSKLQYQGLNPKFSASIPFATNGMPPKLAANFGIIDYNQIKENEITRSQNELEKILVHKIPNYEGQLMFDLEETFELHDSMAGALSKIKGVKLLTTFGDTDLIELQGERTKENKAMEQAYQGVFHSAGLNPNIFIGDSKEAIQASITKDAAYVFKQLNLIINFYNLGVNNLFNFNPFQARINLLPMTVYNEDNKINLYVTNANFGIGKLEAVVATGIRQKDISDKYALEQYLELDKILVPLQSAYTSTPDDQKNKEDVDDNKKTSSKKEGTDNGDSTSE